MPLPDPAHSRAVLIGAAHYRHLEPLPAVARNLEGLAALLRHHTGWGLPAEHLTVVLDPPSADAMLEAVHRAARAATDTLLVYYAGHALGGDDLLLTLPGSDTERLFRSVRFSDVRRELAAAPNKRAVILDCAFRGPVPEVDVPGGWLLTGSPANDLAPAPQHSALTGELLTVLAHGIPDGPETIDTDTLFLRVRHQLRAKQRPEPRQRGRLIALAANRASARTTAPATADIDEQPYLQMPPAVLAESVTALRAQGAPEKAAAALAVCGRLRPDQEVAAIMTALAGLRRPGDVAAVAFAAAGRDPHELRRIYEILVELDQRALAIGLLKVVAVGLPERTARFVAVLDGTTALGAGDPVPALLRAAVGAARQRPGRVVDLLDALLLDRREAAAELALGEAERTLPPADLAVVADALRDGGRDEQAYRLYARAAEAVVRRDASTVAGIVAALPAHVGRSVARQAVTVRVKAPPEHVAVLLSEFEAAGLDDAVSDAVAALSGGLPRPALDQVTRLLRERDRAGIALRLALAAVADRPVDDILRLTESLNEQGRPVDALNLLAHAAQVRSIGDLERLTAAGGPAARRVYAAVAEQAPDRVAAFSQALAVRPGQAAGAPDRAGGTPGHAAGAAVRGPVPVHGGAAGTADPGVPGQRSAGGSDGGRWDQFRAEVLRRPDDEVVAVAAHLIAAGAVPPADDLLRARVPGLAVAAVAAKQVEVVCRLIAVATTTELPWVLRAVLDGFPAPGDAETRLAAMLAELPRRAIAETVAFTGATDDGRRRAGLMDAIAARPVSEIVTVAAAVTRPDSAAAAHELLDVVARGPVRRVAELVEELRRRGERAHLRALVEAFRVRHPDSPDVFKLAGWLWALDEHDVAALAVRGRLWLGETAVGDALACAVAELLHAYAIGSARLDLAYPALGESAAEDLRRTYRIAADEAFLFVLSSPKLRKPTPVVFTQRAIHHMSGEKLLYADLGDVDVTAGRRSAVVVDRRDGAPATWPMPTAAAAREVVDLVGRIQALVAEMHEDVRVTAQVLAGPGNGYEMEGEIS